MSNTRVAIYCRTSTTDQKNSIKNQVDDLTSYIGQRSWSLYRSYVDEGQSGGTDRRPALDQLMADARRGKFRAVIVTRFDRYARSTIHLLQSLEEFRRLNIDFVSIEDSVDTSSMYGKVLFTIIAAFSELERAVIRERVKWGLAKARLRGRQLGRPKINVDLPKVQVCALNGMSFSEIGRQLKISRMTVARALAASTAQKPTQIRSTPPDGAMTCPGPARNH